jgi:hypothetical protein
MATVYLKHPVSADEKAKHKANGDKILDIRFKPNEIPKPEEAPKPEAPKRRPRVKTVE